MNTCFNVDIDQKSAKWSPVCCQASRTEHIGAHGAESTLDSQQVEGYVHGLCFGATWFVPCSRPGAVPIVVGIQNVDADTQ